MMTKFISYIARRFSLSLLCFFSQLDGNALFIPGLLKRLKMLLHQVGDSGVGFGSQESRKLRLVFITSVLEHVLLEFVCTVAQEFLCRQLLFLGFMLELLDLELFLEIVGR